MFFGQFDLPVGYNEALNESKQQNSNCLAATHVCLISGFLVSPWKEKKRLVACCLENLSRQIRSGIQKSLG